LFLLFELFHALLLSSLSLCWIMQFGCMAAVHWDFLTSRIPDAHLHLVVCYSKCLANFADPLLTSGWECGSRDRCSIVMFSFAAQGQVAAPGELQWPSVFAADSATMVDPWQRLLIARGSITLAVAKTCILYGAPWFLATAIRVASQ
jgi:hypothetical protein